MTDEATENLHSIGIANEATNRKLQLFSAGLLQYGIFENEIAAIAEWREPTPLPHAPESVLGVVSIQGRMLTVLDLATIAGNGAPSTGESPKHIIALRGDEQLALAVDSLEQMIEVAADLEQKQEGAQGVILEVFNQSGAEISILNVKQLFPSAIQGRERRRRRF